MVRSYYATHHTKIVLRKSKVRNINFFMACTVRLTPNKNLKSESGLIFHCYTKSKETGNKILA